jgi:acetyl esterase
MVAAEHLGVLVWLHGGGWYVGDVECFDRVTRQLANASGAVCVSVDYRLAPEHRFPAAVDDARAAVRWAAGHGAAQLGTDPKRVVVGGDSAGGNLAAVAARHERAIVRAQLLAYPALDAAMAGDSYREFAAGPMLTPDAMANCWDRYLGDADRADPDASPLAARDLDGLPPAYIAVAGHDVLRDDGLRYAEALRAAGVEVTLDRYDDMVHSFLRWGGVVDRARELIEALGDYARAALA